MKNAALSLILLLVPVFGQAEEHPVYKIADIATQYEALPAHIAAMHAHTKAMAKAHVMDAMPVPTAPSPCNNFLVTTPATFAASSGQTTLHFGCGLPSGSWVITTVTKENQQGQQNLFWHLNYDMLAGSVASWDSSYTQGSGTFDAVILPPSLAGQELVASFGMPSQFQQAYEAVPIFFTGETSNPQRQVLVQGVGDRNLRVLFGNTDVTSKVTWYTSDTILIDVTNVELQNQGSMIPLTIEQGGMYFGTTFILHGNATPKG
jgi:hypothetical protein